jgi:hypothetical protein
MGTVTIRIHEFQAAKVMRALRRWLDARGMIPALFHYDTSADEMLVVRMQFAAEDQADVFAGALRKARADRCRRNKRRTVGIYPPR